MIEKTAAPVKIPPKTQTAPIAEAKPEEAAPPAPPKAISLKPVKKKVKNKVVPPDDTVQREQEKREKEIERVKRQQLAESLRAEQTAAEEARLAAEEAEAERRLMEATQERLAAIRSQASTSTGLLRPPPPQAVVRQTPWTLSMPPLSPHVSSPFFSCRKSRPSILRWSPWS